MSIPLIALQSAPLKNCIKMISGLNSQRQHNFPCQQKTSNSLQELCSFFCQAPNSWLHVPLRNCTVSATIDPAASFQFPPGIVQFWLPRSQPVPRKNYAISICRSSMQPDLFLQKDAQFFFIKPLFPSHSGKCIDFFYLAFLQPGLSLPKFAQFFLLAEPDLVGSHCRLSFPIFITQWLLHNFHQQCLEPSSCLATLLPLPLTYIWNDHVSW